MLKKLLFIIGILSLLGCNISKWLYPSSYTHRNPLRLPFIRYKCSISVNDSTVLFVLTGVDTLHKRHVDKMISYNLYTDSSTTLLSSDTSEFYAPFCSFDGTKIIFISHFKLQFAIKSYDLKTGNIGTIFSLTTPIYCAVLTPRNDRVYFMAKSNLYPNGDTIPGRWLDPPSLYTVNTDGSGFKQVNQHCYFSPLGIDISIDAGGENLYITIDEQYGTSVTPYNVYKTYSDKDTTIPYAGPFKLNLKTNKLISLIPKNTVELDKTDHYNYFSISSHYLKVIPSYSTQDIFLYYSDIIYDYNTSTRNANVFYAQPKVKVDSFMHFHSPTCFHKSNRLLVLTDTTSWESTFSIINANGHIERTFTPSIVKHREK